MGNAVDLNSCNLVSLARPSFLEIKMVWLARLPVANPGSISC